MKNKVLLIDANPMEAEALEQVLRRGGYELTRVLHPREARNFMEERVNLVICDLRSGRDAAFELLRDWSNQHEAPSFVILVEAGDV
jgi:DNA-binding NtrC family response regulator